MNILTALRDLVPSRALTVPESKRVAELQAVRLLTLADIAGPPFPETAITELPGIQVERVQPLAVSAATRYREGRWLILLNGSDGRNRQRLSLAHEFKHILDHTLATLLYPATRWLTHVRRVEALCTYFAGCLLMPVLWLKRAWREGITDVAALAQLFEVSREAMRVRLTQVGLLEPVVRNAPAGAAA